ncbi:MAG TPA: hypothetical protein VKP08_13800, partial [Anaerolineales bacterium]|nr:hypothetical protein [Anaerolineales bacterium]
MEKFIKGFQFDNTHIGRLGFIWFKAGKVPLELHFLLFGARLGGRRNIERRKHMKRSFKNLFMIILILVTSIASGI